jgi:pimeloyl-ACP methyl ester carboxylesterase
MPHLTRDGVRLYYEEQGAGDPPMLFIHGWCCDRTYHAPQAAHFSPKHHCISIDLRGHGESDKPEQGYSIAGFADDVAWLCQELALKRPVIAGMGARSSRSPRAIPACPRRS